MEYTIHEGQITIGDSSFLCFVLNLGNRYIEASSFNRYLVEDPNYITNGIITALNEPNIKDIVERKYRTKKLFKRIRWTCIDKVIDVYDCADIIDIAFLFIDATKNIVMNDRQLLITKKMGDFLNRC